MCRSVAASMQTEVAELRRNLQQAGDHRLRAEQDKKDMLDEVKKKCTLDLSISKQNSSLFVEYSHRN